MSIPELLRVEQSEERLKRIERATELPMLALALLMVPLLILPLTTDLSAQADQWFLIGDYAIWAAFTIEFGAKLLVAPRRLAYIRTHPLEAAMVVVPFLRPLRLMRLFMLLRLAVALGLNTRLIRRFFLRRGTGFVLACLLIAVIGGGTLVFIAEHNHASSQITSIGDSYWWAVVTMTTVGYGDYAPVTPVGRGVAGFLMLFGIAALSVTTASVATLMVREPQQPAHTPTLRDLRIRQRQLRARRFAR